MIKLSPFQWASFNFFGFYCTYGVLLPFLPVWLKHHGYDTDIIGVIVAMGFLFRFIGAMFFSKKVKSANQLIPMSRWLTWLTLGAVIGISFAVESIWLLLPAIALFHILNGGETPLLETIASTWQKQIDLDYSKTRLFGSIAFVVGSVSTGYLIGFIGEGMIIWIMAAFFVLLILGQNLPPTQTFSESDSSQQATPQVTYWQLLKESTTLKMLIAVSLIQSSHAAYYTYSTIHWSNHGISTETSSLLWALGVIAEILLFFFSNRLLKPWKISQLIFASGLMSVIRWAILATTTDIYLLTFSQLLHAITYATGHYAMVRYISTQPTEHIAKLQGLYFGFASCMVMALFTVAAGLVYSYSASGSFWLMLLLVLPAFFFIPKKFNVKVHS